MRRLQCALLAAVAVMGFASVASAADMPVKAPMMAPVYNWTGFYVGGHVGGAFGSADYNWNIPALVESDRAHNTFSSFAGGGQIGFLYQWSQLVAGLEASWTGMSLNSRTTQLAFAANRDFTANVRSLLMVTGRLGMANGAWLPYVKGGFASASVALDTYRTSDQLQQTSSSARANGWTIGAGLDYALTPNWILGVEYNYVQLNGSNQNNVNIAPTIASNHENIGVKINTLLLRASYKFGG